MHSVLVDAPAKEFRGYRGTSLIRRLKDLSGPCNESKEEEEEGVPIKA